MVISNDRERLAVIGFYGLAVLFAYLVYQLFQPFLVPLAWAGVLVICFYPTHRRFERRWGRHRAALLSTVLMALLVIVPTVAVASAFASEATHMAERAEQLLTEDPGRFQRWLQRLLRVVPGGDTLDATALLGDATRRLGLFLSERAAGVFQDAIAFVVYLGMTIFAMYFFFRDAQAVMRGVHRILPFDAPLRERLIEQTRHMVNASVTAAIIVATVQGTLGGLAFWAVGVGAPVFWGVVMGLLCLLPFGAWLVWAPAAIALAAGGELVRGLLLAGVGLVVVSGIDNFLRPVLLSERSEMNGLLLFVSLLGGVAAFGAVGLVLGPVIMAVAVGLFEAYTSPAASRTP